jgi:hypothetical protein
VNRTRAADDFATIRARVEELRRERQGAQSAESELQRDPPMHRSRSLRWPPPEIGFEDLSRMLGRLRKLLFADPIGGDRQTHCREGGMGAPLADHSWAMVLPEMHGATRA